MPIDWDNAHPLIRFWQDEGVAHLDVRELLLNGGEPYSQIMSCVGKMRKGDILAVHALFAPKPLIKQVERRGFQTDCAREGEDHWILRITAP